MEVDGMVSWKTSRLPRLFDPGDYQRCRVEHVCGRLKLKVLAFLWRQEHRPADVPMRIGPKRG